jgi:hypothetical protein
LALAHASAIKLQQASRIDLKADRTAWFGTRYVWMSTHDDDATPVCKRHVQTTALINEAVRRYRAQHCKAVVS